MIAILIIPITMLVLVAAMAIDLYIIDKRFSDSNKENLPKRNKSPFR